MLAQLNRIRKNTTNISVFRGLNRSVNVGFSRVSANNSSIFTEFSDMKNLSSDKFPMLTQRKPRARACVEFNAISNLLSTNGKLIYIDGGGALHYGAKSIDLGFTDKETRRYVYLYGNRAVIMPDKLLYTLGGDKVEKLEAEQKYSMSSEGDDNYIASYKKCSIQKTIYNGTNKSYPYNMLYSSYMDLSDKSLQNYKISKDTGFLHVNFFNRFEEIDTLVEEYVSNPSKLWRYYGYIDAEKDTYIGNKIRKFSLVSSYYIKLAFDENVSKSFKKGDYVKLSGFKKGNTDADYKTDGNENFINIFNDNHFKIYEIIGKSIIIKAEIESSVPYSCKYDPAVTGVDDRISVSRHLPALENNLLIECNNRLWGCSSESNEIYSSKLGDASNWYAFGDGISTDSYAATIGCEGDFTGIARQNDSVIFFKENHIIKLYGTKPSNFTLATYDMQGVEKGSENSLVWINGILYYKGKDGICAYQSGGAPLVISEEAFGDKKYKNCVAGRYKNKYVVSCEDENGGHELFVYDTEKGLWHKEDDTNIISCTTYNNRLYYIDGDTGFLYSFDDGGELLENSGNTENEAEFAWYAQTGDLYDGDLFMKHISRLRIGIKPEKGARLRVLAKFNEFGEWRELARINFHDKRPDVIPVAVRRSQFLKLRIEGFGRADIYAIDIEYAGGSDKR